MDFQVSFDLHHPVDDEQQLMLQEQNFDVVIIGGGPAGLSAGIYAARKGLKAIIVTENTGGQIKDTSSIENYPGFIHIAGESLAHEFYRHASALQIPIQTGEKVDRLEMHGSHKLIHLDSGQTMRAKSVIIATGSVHRKLGVPGEDRLAGRGVAYCAICDGPMYKDKDVIVAGGGNAAVEAVIDLSKIARQVTLVHRSQLRADRILVNRMLALDNVVTYLDTRIVEIMGDRQVTAVRTMTPATGSQQIISADGVFVEIGYTPNTSSFQQLLKINDRGEILTDSMMRTSVPGIFAAGDVVEGPYKQIVVAAGDGAKAALAANEYINQRQTEEELINETA